MWTHHQPVKVVHFNHTAVTAVIELIWPSSWLANNSDHEVDRSKDLKCDVDMMTRILEKKSLSDKMPHIYCTAGLLLSRLNKSCLLFSAKSSWIRLFCVLSWNGWGLFLRRKTFGETSLSTSMILYDTSTEFLGGTGVRGKLVTVTLGGVVFLLGCRIVSPRGLSVTWTVVGLQDLTTSSQDVGTTDLRGREVVLGPEVVLSM